MVLVSSLPCFNLVGLFGYRCCQFPRVLLNARCVRLLAERIRRDREQTLPPVMINTYYHQLPWLGLQPPLPCKSKLKAMASKTPNRDAMFTQRSF